MWHLREAESVAKAHYQTQHSNDRSGASQEVIPQWVAEFFDLFSMTASEANNSAQTAAARNEHQGVAGSLASRQAPLGVCNGPAELRTKTARNSGAPVMRQQVIGNVDVENVYEGLGKVDGEFVEGRDDVTQRHVTPRQRITNGTHR
jgi:hypothetical protein